MIMTEQNMQKPLISVIIPVYHVDKYLGRCLNSILDQTYENLELIVVDDGSDDKCPEICDSFAEKDSRIIVIHKENGGVADARNCGLSKASGEFITFVDPDDYINKNMYDDMMHKLFENNADIVMCDFKYVYEDDVVSEISDHPSDVNVDIISGSDALYQSYSSYKNGVLYSVLWNKICRRELYEDLVFPTGRIYEDEARVFMILYKAAKIAYIDHPYYFYHQHRQSIVGKRWNQTNLQLLDAYIDKLEFYGRKKEYELFEKELIHILHMFCYTKSKLDEEGIQMDLSEDSQGRRCIKIVNELMSDCRLSIKSKIEYVLFSKFSKAYYYMWQIRQKS
ncbi:Glycosyltransferase involved in cell wall bisynthesis [Lachnospiraceae bacterium]|nr:Glycosyltransferase involved in cell wall bisynthesis [Lachnospiraceae bacterium]